MIATLFDTETNGLVANRTLQLDKQPSVIEFYAVTADLCDGRLLEEYETLIKPPTPLLDKPTGVGKSKGKTITQMTGITNEMLTNAPNFEAVANKVFSLLQDSSTIIGHNLSFDRDMLELEAERLGVKIKWPTNMLCTVEQTIHVKGYRFTLTDLHSYLFNEGFTAHRAKSDTQALLRCCVKLHEMGLV